MTSLTRLLASSRLSSYQPGLGQVYTASAAHLARGDFGMKRPLPTVDMPPGKVRYVEVSDMDTREGQVAWREKERDVIQLQRWSETHVKLTDPVGQAVMGESAKLGPRINTVYDPSTRRAVPTFYDEVQPKEVREHLQREARQGRGPIHQQDPSGSTSDNDAFLGAARLYSSSMSLAPRYANMSQAKFEKFLEQVRASRGEFKKQLALSAAQRARQLAVKKLNERRLAIVKQAARAKEEGATKVEVPEEVTVRDLPLPNADEVRADLWDQSRLGVSCTLPWLSWMSWKEHEKASRPGSKLLPVEKEDASTDLVNTNANLTPSLHKHAGLQYSQPDSIQTQLLAPPLPGRVLEKMGDDEKSYKKEGWAAAVAGRIAYIKNEHDGGLRAIDWSGNDARKGVGYFRPTQAWRERTVRNVSADGQMSPVLGYTRLGVRASESSDRNRLARGTPGSPSWVAEIDGYLHRHSGEGYATVRDFTMGDGSMGTNPGNSRFYGAREQRQVNRRQTLRQRGQSKQQDVTAMLGNILNKIPPRKKKST